MPRRRHEEERSSSFPRPSPRTERRSVSRPRPTSARSQSPQTSGRSASRSSPQPRPAPATTPVAAPATRTPPQARPASVAASAPARSQSSRTESSTPHTASSNSCRASSDDGSYKASSDGGYSMFEGMLRGLRRASSDDRASSDYSYSATNDGGYLFGSIVRALICPRPVVVSEDASTAPVEAPVAVPVSPCDTQAKAFQDCLHDFETDISKCQFYMNVLSQCKKFSDSKFICNQIVLVIKMTL